jgi:hypothetical protein
MDLIVTGDLINGIELDWMTKRLKNGIVLAIGDTEFSIEIVLTNEEMKLLVQEWTKEVR